MRKAQAAVNLPVALLAKGEFWLIIRAAARSGLDIRCPYNTPMVPNLRIAWMVPAGDGQCGDPVIRFDSSSAQQELMQREAALRQSQATLDQAVAQAKITQQQDLSELANAKLPSNWRVRKSVFRK